MSRLFRDGWHIVLGIETHAQINSTQKLFSSAPTSLLAHDSNTRFNAFDAAFPGTLPLLNPKCVLLALRASLALNCRIQNRSTFDRKHYFYPDLPVGYQITQHYAPIAKDGYLELPVSKKRVRIQQVQMEQDTAKSISEPRAHKSHIDLNRSGTGLLEIVTEPDLQSPEEASEYVRALQATLRAVGASDGNMESGSMRCDVNVSVNRSGDPFGTRCEIKNVNSFRYIVGAINFEVDRQIALISSGQAVEQETRGFDHYKWETFKLRSKEDAPDYRYMPDPNLGVLTISQSEITNIRDRLPPLPDAIRSRLLDRYESQGVSVNDVDILMGLDTTRLVPFDGEHSTQDMGAVDYFEQVVDNGRRSAKAVSNWMLNNLLGQLSAHSMEFSSTRVPPEQLGALVDLVTSNTITTASGKLLLRHLVAHPSSASVEQVARSLKLVEDQGDDLSAICQRVVEAMPKEVASFKSGNENVVNRLLGKVMKDTRGRADAHAAKTTLLSLLKSY
ncbi:Glutamyl-tRNA amidotransferase B subunit [Cylindrobasidium torrendii FP15055 ss-10]|uniref:Glutamyl-tRNA(Gln) amidotransferase subunit B, mitochondrial n=1 Tax=Cylindrobasidium torrendii FP15055 ss-10 TaxID=1314674 RepID=A0A0D7BS88_9AGAR|nr:Glutamyl-tRNA amidotransferase B subunit [Cylindrobasidium torrendii FP15055 ss-10]